MFEQGIKAVRKRTNLTIRFTWLSWLQTQIQWKCETDDIRICLPHSIVKSSSPKLGTVSRYVDTRCAISVTLELSHQGLIVKVPYCDVTVWATAEAHL